jgi:CheY-like chemotaxis protein
MGKRILLADDSVTIQKVVELTFMDEDYEVTAVSNGDEAVARLADVQPDLVIADVHMPGSSGYDVCRAAKRWRAAVPVLLLVGTFEPFQEAEAKAAAADGYLKKPFDSQELLRRVDELLQAAAAAPAIQTPADEMEVWQATEAPEAEASSTEVWSGAVIEDGPTHAGPLEGQSVPEEIVLESSPWEDAQQQAATWQQPAPAASSSSSSNWWSSPQAAEPAAVPAPAPAPVAAPAAAPSPAPAAASASPTAGGALSDADVERIARRVVELIGDRLLREVAWEVVPDMAELVIKDRLRELERQLEA